jgi:hypothetical protein
VLTIFSSERGEADFASDCKALVLFGVRAYDSIFGSSANFDTMLPTFCSTFGLHLVQILARFYHLESGRWTLSTNGISY